MNRNGHKGEGYVRSHLRASSKGSGKKRGSSRLLLVIACIAMLATLVVGLSAASAAPPVVTMGTVTNPGYTTAHGTGEINAEGTGYYVFEASTDATNWEPKWSSYGELSGTNPHSISGTIGELQPETHYFIRLKFSSSADGSETFSSSPYSEITTLGPVPKPTVTQVAVTEFTATTAHFSGKIDPGAASTDPALTVRWHFVCEPDCLGLSHGSDEFVDDGNESTVVTDAEIEPNIDYTIKLVAENMGGANSAQTTLHSQATAPVVKTLGGFALGNGSEALIGGEVDSRNSPTEYWLEYGPGAGGPGANYPSAVPATKDATVPQVSGTGDLTAGSNRIAGATATSGSFAMGQTITGPGIPPLTKITGIFAGGELRLSNGVAETAAGAALHATGPQVVTRLLTGLEAGAAYHFRIVAKNSSGTVEGNDVSFETVSQSPPSPSTCPNEKLRSETHSEALGECRAYEMTTPVEKNGGDANVAVDISADGSGLGYYSSTAFSEPKANQIFASYITRRTSAGWVSRSMDPKTGAPGLAELGGHFPADFNSGLTAAVMTNRSSLAQEPLANNVFRVGYDGSETWVSSPTVPISRLQDKNYVGRSADGSHILFESVQPFERHVKGYQIWEWFNGKVTLVSEVPGPEEEEEPSPLGAVVGDGSNDITQSVSYSGTLPQQTAVSEDGERIFFTANRFGSGHVFVREGGTHTREIDLSQRAGHVGEPPDAGFAGFVGAAADGSIAYLKSPSLLTDDAPAGGGLYAYNLDSGHLSLVAPGSIEGTTPYVSHDGLHIYFSSREVLVPGSGVKGGHNLYVATPTGSIQYIATLNDDDGPIWQPSVEMVRRLQTNADGRTVFFQSYERLTAFDNAGHAEIYRYDTVGQDLTCVSCGLSAAPAKGDASIVANPIPRATPTFITQFGRTPLVSADGHSMLFQTTEALLPADVNGLADVYLFQNGHLSMISGGTSKFPSEVAGLSSDGSDAFFSTRDALVGQDIDGGNADIYDARIDGGFPAPTSGSLCESESACQGSPSPAPSFTTPPSTAPGRGNPKPEGPKPCKKAKKAKSRCGSKKLKKHKAKKHHKPGAAKTGRGK